MSKLFIASVVGVLASADPCWKQCSGDGYPCLDGRVGVDMCYHTSNQGGCGAGHFYCPTGDAEDNLYRCGVRGCPENTCVHVGEYDGTCYPLNFDGSCPHGTFKCLNNQIQTPAPTPSTPSPTGVTPSPTLSTGNPTLSPTDPPTDPLPLPDHCNEINKVCTDEAKPCADERAGVNLCYKPLNNGGCTSGHRWCPLVSDNAFRCGIRGCPEGTCVHIGEKDGTCYPSYNGECPNGTFKCENI